MSTLQGVANTLFIPLTARIFASEKFPEYFYDKKALALKKHLPDDTIRENSSEYTMMASVARYYNVDHIAKAFIRKHKRCNIVYLGAGLETAYYRLNESTPLFYEVDLPDVIEYRRNLLGEHENERLIGGDLFDFSWAESVDKSMPTMILASGVFQYFTEDRILGFIDNLRRNFKEVELVFDATNETGIKYANKYVRKTGNTSAAMHFFINDSNEFAERAGAHLIEERAFFTDARRMLKKKLRLYTRIAMKIVDDKKRAILVHLAIN